MSCSKYFFAVFYACTVPISVAYWYFRRSKNKKRFAHCFLLFSFPAEKVTWSVPIGSDNLPCRPITGRRAERRRPTWWTCVWRPPPPSSPTISSSPPSNQLIPPPLRPSWAAAALSLDAAARFWARAAASSPTEAERIAASSLTEVEGTVRPPASTIHSACSLTLGRVMFAYSVIFGMDLM